MCKSVIKKYQAMQADLSRKAETGKLEDLTVSDFDCICQVGKELLKHHAVKTFIKKVADYFQKFGFMVTMDFDQVQYVIVEA